MNNIQLTGTIRNIEYSHTINDVDYDKADLVVQNGENDEVISLRFKKYSNVYQEGEDLTLVGNVRSYSRKLETGKNKVDIYVFTYFDKPDNDIESDDYFELDGRICKIDPIHTSQNGKQNIHFVLANNIISSESNSKINNYIPMVCYGTVAKQASQLSISDTIKVTGYLHSRTYKKYYDDGSMEILVAHEGVVQSIEQLQ